jgi:hypothetical protein
LRALTSGSNGHLKLGQEHPVCKGLDFPVYLNDFSVSKAPIFLA